MRSTIALTICIGSALLLGYFCVFQHRSPVVTLWELALVWFNVAWWLGGTLGKLLGLRAPQIHQAAKRGSLKLTGLALGIERAAFVWVAAAIVLFLVR